ncbi:hypothetical protein Gotur_009266 [Gossypium turneri]
MPHQIILQWPYGGKGGSRISRFPADFPGDPRPLPASLASTLCILFHRPSDRRIDTQDQSLTEWIVRFNHDLGDCSIFDAELWGIWDGLLLLQMIQTDCLEVVKAIQESYSVSSNSALLRRIQQMLQSRNHWVIRHVIAKMSFIGKKGMQMVEYVLRELIDTFR